MSRFGIHAERLAIPGSFNKSQKRQLEMIEDLSQELQQEFPDARVVMLPATAYAQADKAYLGTGQVLFRNIFARALDQTFGVDVANVGRDSSGDRLRVDGWGAKGGGDGVGAVPAVVCSFENRQLLKTYRGLTP